MGGPVVAHRQIPPNTTQPIAQATYPGRTTRGWSQNNRFDEAWALIAATYQVQVTVMTNVVDLARHKNRAKKVSV